MRTGWIVAIGWLWASASWASSDYEGFAPKPGAGVLHYYVSAAVAEPQAAVIVLHGHPRDARNTLDAAVDAVTQAGQARDTVVVAPQFQVADSGAEHCSGPGVPAAQPDDLLWTCRSWVDGAPAENAATMTSYAALDALVLHLHQQWPSLRRVTIAGFSAGAQMVQHYLAYAAAPPAELSLRYVVASPGSWLYFDALPGAVLDACPQAGQWRYGTENAPSWLPRTAAQARAHYAAADISYLVGELDSSPAKGTFYPILDKSCAAMNQGPYRLQRAQAFVAYAARTLPTARPARLVVVPDCAHDVRCVFPAPAARQALLGR